ncbi:type VII secretion protein EccCb [Solihabitans fulvus]|uniref:Type VII secretion protein EccCb n=1 Tax=Solihabitans fulvus TaxID=1892852 RepID=A0A5B2XDI1_9PSEU|nr:type VII secretion protein EccCb [Solihabitans fulvus]
MHVVATARHWSELPADVYTLLRGRIELGLDDPAESRLSPALAATLPDLAGWGLYAGRPFLTALDRSAEIEPQWDGELPVVDPSVWHALVLAPPGAVLGAVPAAPVAQADPVDPLDSSPQLLALLDHDPPRTTLFDWSPDPAAFDVQQAWRPRTRRDRYRVPFGIDESGSKVELDIKEPAQHGMGPHGLLIGATGSGKSELLRTLVLGLAATHSSATLNMILVDFKGGATFRGLGRLPHVAATITNLADDLTLVDRMRDAIAGEIARRQELLSIKDHANVDEYERARRKGADLDPLPALFVCIDEFSELLTAKPEFIDLFVQIGRIGRSLGIHLLLASQRLEEGKLRGLDTHLSYRIALRTFTTGESRAVLGRPDAYELPATPGSGYLAVQGEPLVRFRSAYVSTPHLSGEEDAVGPAVLDLLVDRMAGEGPPAHPIWLPPLDASPVLTDLLPPLIVDEQRGFGPAGPMTGALRTPVGRVDRPFEQRHDLLMADFSGAAGHGAIVGGPQSGKSVMLRTLITSMALTHTPEEVQFYCLDLGGGTLQSLRGLPHVGDVAGRLDVDRMRRTVTRLTDLLRRREARFRELGIHSPAEFRDRRGDGGTLSDEFGDVFLVIDGWQTFRQEFEELESDVVGLATRGLSYGVHLVLTANRWADIRPAVKDLILTRFELRLGDPSESEVNRRAAAAVPTGRPGRGLIGERLHFLAALPVLGSDSTLADGVTDTVEYVARSWHGPTATPVTVLPTELSYQDLLAEGDQPAKGRLVPIGVDEDHQTVYLDFAADPHFVAFADAEHGKTNLLRTIVRGITDRYTSNEAAILLVDYRRTMLGLVDRDYQIGYAVSSNQFADMLKDVRDSMANRLPGPDVTQEQLRNRSWWKGPELFIVVDDYDLVVTSSVNPLLPLADFLPQAKDIGLHLIVARRSGGAARAVFDQILGKLVELAGPGLVMSGNRNEGPLLGNVRPTPLPPGRGALVSRRHPDRLVQVALLPQDEPEPSSEG